MFLCQVTGFHATKSYHFTGSGFSTSILDYAWVGLRLCMGLARDLWQLLQVCCGTWPQFSNTVPGSISPGTDRGSDFLSLVTEGKKISKTSHSFRGARLIPQTNFHLHPQHSWRTINSVFCCPLYSLLLHLCCELLCQMSGELSWFCTDQCNCLYCSHQLSYSFPKGTKIYFFLSVPPSIRFLAVEALLKPHAPN